MQFVARHTNRVSADLFGDIRSATVVLGKAVTPITCLALADAAKVVTAGVAGGAIGYAVGHNVQ